MTLNQRMHADLQNYRSRISEVMEKTLVNSDIPPRLLESMRYSLLSGGKRIRALLVYASGSAFDAPLPRLDAIAMALECIHAYSLIHDDLPAMDNDELRRGKPTNHITFDEATAILAGDALQTLAFEVITMEPSLSDQQVRKIIRLLANKAGAIGMVGGQSLDIEATQPHSEKKQVNSISSLKDIHQRKTGALIVAAVRCGALASDCINIEQHEHLNTFAHNLGLAFQVIDDILDVEQNTDTLGKVAGADDFLGKTTYPTVLGLSESKEFAEKLYQQAIESLALISNNTHLLEQIAEFVLRRHF